MKTYANNSHAHQHGHAPRRNETILTAVQALFGGSVVYRLFAHFMKDDEFRAQIEKLVPKERLPLIAAGTVAAGAIGLVSQRRSAHHAEAELGRALEEMTEEARDLRRENDALRSGTEAKPRPQVREARYDEPVETRAEIAR